MYGFYVGSGKKKHTHTHTRNASKPTKEPTAFHYELRGKMRCRSCHIMIDQFCTRAVCVRLQANTNTTVLLYKQNQQDALSVCIYSTIFFCTTLHVTKDHFVHHQEFMIYCICSSVQTMQTCLTARLHGLYRAADTVNHELLMVNEMIFRNMCSCTKTVEKIHTESASCWFCLYNWLRCTVHTMSDKIRQSWFSGAFVNLRKATIPIVMSVRMEKLGSHWNDFHEI